MQRTHTPILQRSGDENRRMAVVSSPFPSIPIPDVNFVEFCLSAADKHGSEPAFIASESGEKLRYDEIRPLVRRIASGLRRAGLQKGDVVLMCMNVRIEVLPIVLGIVAAGGIFTPCYPQLTSGEIHSLFTESSSVFLFVQDIFLQKVLQATNAERDMIKNIFVTGDAYEESSRVVTPFSFLTSDSGDLFSQRPTVNVKEDAALIFYSSGTTGRQKGVVITHYDVVAMTTLCLSEDGLFSNTKSTVVFTPNYHISGFFSLILSVCNGLGCVCVMMETFDLERFLFNVQRYACDTTLFGPPIAILMAKDPRVKRYDLSSLREMFIGAAPFGAEEEHQLRSAIGHDVDIRQGYAMTECCPVTLVPPHTSNKHGSVGVVRPNVTVKIVDITSGATLGTNMKGELCARSPCSTKGYLKNPQANKDLYDADGWLHTGDVAYYDSDGYFYIMDRIKELIKCDGFQVPPAELESLLLGHPDVADVCVIGVPDEMAGEVPKAFVVIKPGTNVNGNDIAKYVQDRVSSYKWLRGGVEFVSTIPKSPSGKILRKHIRAAERPITKKEI